jgi:hypothetical protein
MSYLLEKGFQQDKHVRELAYFSSPTTANAS